MIVTSYDGLPDILFMVWVLSPEIAILAAVWSILVMVAAIFSSFSRSPDDLKKKIIFYAETIILLTIDIWIRSYCLVALKCSGSMILLTIKLPRSGS